jgi:hypothetical protein
LCRTLCGNSFRWSWSQLGNTRNERWVVRKQAYGTVAGVSERTGEVVKAPSSGEHVGDGADGRADVLTVTSHVTSSRVLE